MAIAPEVRKKYRPAIGIETHVQLKTKTKLFSAVSNDATDASPNSLISHIDAGMPGALPVLNREAVVLCVLAAKALNTEIQSFSSFERKHYFYPDLPKGYQITQYEAPIIKGGFLDVPSESGDFRVDIERANLEEDAGKNTHPDGADYSLVDLNRAGTPLLEIVSRPDMHNPEQAKAFAREMWLTMKYCGATEGNLYLGHVRFDVNVSVSQDTSKLGIRSEIKNLNSFRSVENAVAYEIDRQIELLEKGQPVIQETRGWDEAKQKSLSQRGKEEAHDYRYMPEPDIPPLDLDEKFISTAEKNAKKSPFEIRDSLYKQKLPRNVIEDILDNPAACAKILKSVEIGASAEIANRIAFDSLEKPETLSVKISDHIKIAEAFHANILSSTTATVALEQMVHNNNQDVNTVIDSNKQQSDESEIEKIVGEVLENNKNAADDVKNGEMKAIGFLVGQVMAKSKGKANPQLAQQIIKKQLGLS